LFSQTRFVRLASVSLVALFILTTAPGSSGNAASQATSKKEKKASGPQPRLLELNKPIEGELRKGETQSFQVTIKRRYYARLLVNVKNTDLSIKLFDPDGNPVADYLWSQDSPDPVGVSVISSHKRSYRLEITSREKDDSAKPYSIKLADLRRSEKLDIERVEAERQFAAGEGFRAREVTEERRPALKNYTEALRLWRAAGDREKEAMALNALGRVHDNLGERDKAFDYFSQTLTLRRELKDRAGEAGSLSSLAGIHNSRGERQKALELHGQALEIRRELKDRRGEAASLHNLGQAYLGLNQRDKALQHYEQALKIRQEEKDRRGEAVTSFQLGVLSRQMGKNDQALSYYNQALPVFQELGDKRNEAVTYSSLAALFLRQGKRRDGLSYLEKAYDIQHALGAKQGESSTLQMMGSVYDEMGEQPKAIEFFTRAEQLQREINFQPGLGLTLLSFGGLYDDLGERKHALEYYNQARPVLRATGGPAQEAFAMTNIANIYAAQGDRQTALDYHLQTLAAFTDAKTPDSQASALNNIGSIYLSLNERQLAIDYFNQALAIRQKLGNPFEQAETMGNLGVAYQALDEKQKAVEYFEKALELGKANRRTVAFNLTSVAPVYNDLGESQKALDALTRSLALMREIKDRAGEANALHNLGWTYRGLKQPGEARSYLTQSLDIYTSLGNRGSEAITRYALAKVENEAGNLSDARSQIESALELTELLRSNVASKELRASYFTSVQRYYDLYIEILMKQHERREGTDLDATALQASERARARSLLDLLSESGANIRQGADAKLLERENDIRQLINAKADRQVRLRVANAPKEKIEEITKELQTLTAEFQQVQAGIRASSPRYAALTQPQTLSLKEIQALLDPDTLLLEYFLGDEQSFLWAVTPETMQTYKLPKRSEINKAARQVYELLIARNSEQTNETDTEQRQRIAQSDAELAAASKELSRLVIDPVAGQLGKKRLVIVAQGALQYVPFSALTEPAVAEPGKVQTKARRGSRRAAPPASRAVADKPLIVDHEIINLPSASTLAVLRHDFAGRTPAAKALAVFADPVFDAADERIAKITVKAATSEKANDKPKPAPVSSEQTRRLKHINEQFGQSRIPRLPFTRQEAEQILSLVPENDRKSAMDFAANRASVTTAELSQYRMIHFATHGLINSQQPELSSIVLSLVDEKGQPQEGFVRSHEIYNLNLPAELIVLSACETGLGKEVKGEGLVGLTRGFMYAGSPRVVVSLWSVNDRATSELMTMFYQKMLKESLRPAAALRAAQIEMAKDKKWNAPYYWAAFALQGEWR
jgi:CHAT domain-containing protein/tetratricopeptide (TPR) repeat protein